MNCDFWSDRRVLVTGHTGFKGAWLSLVLCNMGAKVTGLALPPPTKPNLFDTARIDFDLHSVIGDIRDHDTVQKIVTDTKPEVVFHLAAQSIVRQSYETPLDTYATNVMGTVNLLEACRRSTHTSAIVIVTSDKCYENNHGNRIFTESDRLGAGDPYSTSKACAELVAASYRSSFPESACAGVASVRAGNVIGGGDWSRDRLLPDLVSAFADSRPAILRNPKSIRPWQHVLDPIFGYMQVAEGLHNCRPGYASAWNFGPDSLECLAVEDLANLAALTWGENSTWTAYDEGGPAEAVTLRLDSSKARKQLGWRPNWNTHQAVEHTIQWYKNFFRGADARTLTAAQINLYRLTNHGNKGTNMP